MNILFILIGFSLVIAIIFLVAFIISVNKGQYDDTYSPAHRILFDNQNNKTLNKNKKSTIIEP